LVRSLAHPTIESAPASIRWEALTGPADQVADDADRDPSLATILEHARAGKELVLAVPGPWPLLDPLALGLAEFSRELVVELVPSFPLALPTEAAAIPVASLPSQVLTAADTAELNPLQPALILPMRSPEAPEVLRSLERLYPADHRVFTIDASPDRHLVHGRRLSELQDAATQTVSFSLYLPPVAAEWAPGSPMALRRLVHRLRAPGGCPWDREQTATSLIRYVIEEAYEVAEAIEHGTDEQVADELGDLLLQVYLQAEIAEEEGRFSLADVTRAIGQKLVRRHPHVFAGLAVTDAREVQRNWDQIKQSEKGGQSSNLTKGIPRSLPALSQAQELQRKLAKQGFDWHSDQGAYDKLDEEIDELKAARDDPQATESELGDVLFILAKLASNQGLDAERALRGAIQRVSERYDVMLALAAERDLRIQELGLEAQLALWQEAKRQQRGRGARI
jgi:MazG family protein